MLESCVINEKNIRTYHCHSRMVSCERAQILQSKKTIEKRRGCGIGRSYYMFEDKEERVKPKNKKGSDRGHQGRPRRNTSLKECKHACNNSMRSGLDGVKKSLSVLTKGLSRNSRSEKSTNIRKKNTISSGEKGTSSGGNEIRHTDGSESEHGQKEERSSDVLYYDSYVQFMSGSSPKS